MSNSSDDEMPGLEEFEEKQVSNKKQDKNFVDYASNRSKEFEENQKKIEKQLQEQIKKEEQQKLEESKKKGNQDGLFGGAMKKGFFSNKPVQKKEVKKEEITVVTKQKVTEDPLKIKEVQDAMKQNDFLKNNKETWLNNDLLTQVAKNPKLQKLFTNPQYLHDIQQMEKNPKEIQQKYANNREFQELFKEFSQTMSGHFSSLSDKYEKKGQEEQTKKAQQVADPEVDKILKDEKVQALIEYMQKTQKVDFHRIMQADPELGKKIQILINKGYFNLQRQ